MRNLSPGMAMLMMILLLAMGCADSGDERLRQLAQQALYEQSEQDKRLAEQSKQITEASRRLVEGDAAARKDLLEAQKQLTSELHTERASLDRQREEMEQERRNIAAHRHRDPLIAQTISTLGVTLACLLPLLLAGYVIYALNRSSDENDALSEMLIMEMTAYRPLLLPSSLTTVVAIEHTPSSLDAPDEPDPASDP